MANKIITINDLPFSAFASAVEVGLENIQAEAVKQANYINRIGSSVVNLLTEPVDTQGKVWGGDAQGSFEGSSEDGVPMPVATSAGLAVHFPLKIYKRQLAWSNVAFAKKTAGDVQKELAGIAASNQDTILKSLRNAIFCNDNYTFVDRLDNGQSLTVRRFLNADSAAMPAAPDGTTFTAASHNHYIARASTLARTDLYNSTAASGLISTVHEHIYNPSGLKVFVNPASASGLQALTYDGGTNTTGFVPAAMAGLKNPSTIAEATSQADGMFYDGLIGAWVCPAGAVPVYVASWVPSNYVLCVATDEPVKPLAFRQPKEAELKGLRLASTENVYPNIKLYYENQYGFGAFNRAAGAVLYIGNTTWADPTLTGGGYYGDSSNGVGSEKG